MEYKNTVAPHNPKPSGQIECTKVLAITGIPIVQTGSGRNRKMGVDI